MQKSKMQLTGEEGTDFWNDSCDLRELGEAISHGAVGATSNPVIVSTVVGSDTPRWGGRIDALVRAHPAESEDDIAWRLIADVGSEASRLLLPVFERTGGKKGRLSVQVNPKNYGNCGKMVAQGMEIASVAPNLAIKLPATEAGIRAVEELTARGISVTATVSFTVAQAAHCAQAIERGLERAAAAGKDVDRMSPSVVIMVGRLDDLLRRVMLRDGMSVDPGILEWAGIAVVKKLHGMFHERKYRSRLLIAAYRNHMHWSELIGGDLILTIPYKWWNQFNASSVDVRPRMAQPVGENIVEQLYGSFDDFRRAYDEDGMGAADFLHYGATVHTLNEFISGYARLLEVVRGRMLR